jgi:NAD(P)-dependent dehydrogenase (short-subunit alcohol dehydrogenase family)
MTSSHRSVLITGGARGIGFACAHAFAQQGWSVAVVDLDGDAAHNAAGELRAAHDRILSLTADVSIGAQVGAAVQAAVAAFDGLTVLVNNAGFSQAEPSAEISDEHWDRMVDVHLKGAFLCCRAAYPALRRTQSAAVVNITSVAAFAGLPGRLAYSVAKAGLSALTRVLATEWASEGIRVNAVAPAWTETALVHRAVEIGTVSIEQIARRIPLNRLARPEEVASAVYYLAAEASFVTGQTLLVDGGYTIDGRL